MNWNGKKVLVTGADGFIGSHLAERMVKEGATVKAFVYYNSFSSAGWLEDSPSREFMEVVQGDIRDSEVVDRAVAGCDVVFHLAALISVPYSFQAPESFIETNVRGTLNVLQGARRSGRTLMVQTSTSEVYGTPSEVPIRETHPLQAQSPYAASKIAADKLAQSFFHSYDLPVVVLRPFNTYGPRQSTRAVLPTIVSQLLAGGGQVRLGALWPRRDLTYVDDTVQGFVRAAEVDSAIGRTVQLGTGCDIAIGELANLAIEVLNRPAELISTEDRMRPRGSEVDRLISDPTMARELLGWEPATSLSDGIVRVARWLEDHVDPQKAATYVI